MLPKKKKLQSRLRGFSGARRNAELCYTFSMERMDDLQFDGLVLYQDTDYARFNADALKLCAFLRLSPADRVVELGSGTGVICILGERKTGASFTGVERQTRLVELAEQSARQNNQAIRFLAADVAEAPERLGRGAFTAVVMNPPYFESGEPSPNASVAAARHGAAQARECFLDAAFQLLNNGGKLFLIDLASALADVTTALRAHRLEPKRMQLLYTKPNAPARRVLIEAKKLGRPGLVVEPPDWLQE